MLERCEDMAVGIAILTSLHTCLLRLYRICSGKSLKSIRHSGNTDSLSLVSKVPDSVIHEKTTNVAFLIFSESY